MKAGSWPPLLLMAVALAASGCALDPFDPVLAGGRDAGTRDGGDVDAGGPGMDAGGRDAGAPTDAATVDSGRTDAAPPDAGPPDAGTPDAGAPDAGPLNCDAVFGGLPGYLLCQEVGNRCRFFVDPAGNNAQCDDVCTSVGGVCVNAFREDPTSMCLALEPSGCTASHDDMICVCMRP